MRRRMPINFEGLRIAISQKPKIGIFFQRLGNINEIAVGFGNERGVGQTLANRFSDIERGRPFRDFFHTSVRKFDMDAVCHRLEPVLLAEPSVYWRVWSGSNGV